MAQDLITGEMTVGVGNRLEMVKVRLDAGSEALIADLADPDPETRYYVSNCSTPAARGGPLS